MVWFQTFVMGVYIKNSLFSSDSDVCSLEIMAYYDDVEVCNPLGSRAKKHKLGMYVLWRFHSCYDAFFTIALFYYTLGNISPKHRSSLRSIQLMAILKSNDLQRYGPDKVLECFIDGCPYKFRGTITLIPADNLASQYLGGYKALNAALRKCRHCLAVKEDMQSQYT